MPTRHRRHAVTETPPVKEALDELRREQGNEKIALGEIVILGAQLKAERLRAQRDERAMHLRQLADMIRTGDIPVDLDAAEEVRRRGWARE